MAERGACRISAISGASLSHVTAESFGIRNPWNHYYYSCLLLLLLLPTTTHYTTLLLVVDRLLYVAVGRWCLRFSESIMSLCPSNNVTQLLDHHAGTDLHAVDPFGINHIIH